MIKNINSTIMKHCILYSSSIIMNFLSVCFVYPSIPTFFNAVVFASDLSLCPIFEHLIFHKDICTKKSFSIC